MCKGGMDMTIKQAAEKYNVSPQAVYQRLKKKKILVESITEKGTGELTPEGEMILDNLFNPEKQPFKANSRAYANEQENTIKELRAQIAELIEQKKSAEERAEFFKSQQAETNKALEKALDAQQNLINRLLPAPQEQEKPTAADKPRKLTWKERFTGRTGK